MDITQIDEAEEHRRRLFFRISAIGAIITCVSFTIEDLFLGERFEVFLDGSAVVILGVFVFISFWNQILFYRPMLLIMTIVMNLSLAYGTGHGSVSYWMLCMPIFYVSFLPSKEAFLWGFVETAIMTILLLFPNLFDSFDYTRYFGIRILGAFIFILFVSIVLERGRERYQRLVLESNKAIEMERKKLAKALSNIKQLKGMLPICACCKKVRDDEGYWSQIEQYLVSHSEATFSHGICPECAKKLYGEDIE